MHNRAIQSSVLTVKHRHSLTVKQHTVNPLIAPDVNPFLPSAIMFFFFFALITVLVSLGMSVTPSQYPSMSECPTQSRHKSLIAAIS
ncbi:unnamed protein product, partial [Staurois parvus]